MACTCFLPRQARQAGPRTSIREVPVSGMTVTGMIHQLQHPGAAGVAEALDYPSDVSGAVVK